MDYLRAIQLKAMRSVLRPGDPDFFVRRVLRWYSKTFHTPIEHVEDLPLEDVLLAWYEEEYLTMTSEEREETLRRLLLTEEEFHDMVIAEEVDDAEMFEMSKMEAAAQAEGQKNKKLAPVGPTAGPIVPHELPESVLDEGMGSSAQPPPEIKMDFVDPAEFERELQGFGSMDDGDLGKG